MLRTILHSAFALASVLPSARFDTYLEQLGISYPTLTPPAPVSEEDGPGSRP
jgi:hypothetical protein